MASSTLMFRISSIFLSRYRTSRISGLKRLPPQDSHTIVTSAMNCIPIFTKPSPWHSGQRPPSWLKEKKDGVKPLIFANCWSLRSLRMSS